MADLDEDTRSQAGNIPHRVKAAATPAARHRPKNCQKMQQSRSKSAGSAGLLEKEVVSMEEPIPLSQQFSETLEEATKEFLALLLRIGFAEEEQEEE
jgi:hypothetical protein